MPSHKIHLAIAKKVNDKLNLDLDSIMLGSVLPDLAINRDHGTSHYQIDGTYEEKLANPDKFVKEYKIVRRKRVVDKVEDFSLMMTLARELL